MKIRRLMATLWLLLAVGLVTTPVFAQATRTWISGVGDDANPCSRTAPCKTFAGAISKTAAGGEINCLDPGGFGALTITKAISIICKGVEGGVLVAGTNGITIAAGPSDQITLDGLDLNGSGSGLDGVSIQSAAEVVMQNCNIHSFSGNGVTITTTTLVRVIIRACTISENGNSGVVVNSTPGFGHVRVFNSLILTNAYDGVSVNGTGNEALLSNVEILGNTRQLNTSTNVSGGIIYSLGNNTILSSSGNNPTPFAIK